MNFVQFAQAHGLVMRGIQADACWHRVPTEDKPKHRNGAYKYLGDVGFVQNHATMDSIAVWRPDVTQRIAPLDLSALRARQQAAERAERLAQVQAADNAINALKTAKLSVHPYLARKGFPDELGSVDADGRLLIPMRSIENYRTVQSVQRIEADGSKKFLHGGKSKGAVFIFNRGALERWYCEGYATGLSIRDALVSIHRRAEVVVCFSASNLQHVSGTKKGFVFADNDASQTGQMAAQATGLPWVTSPIVGEDANDLHARLGLSGLAKLLRESYAKL